MNSADLNQRKSASLAGYMFLFYIVVSMVHYTVIELNLAGATPGNVKAFIRGDELLFRAGIIIDLTLFITGLAISITLYDVLRTVNHALALLAVTLLLVHTTVAVVIEFSSFFSLLIADNQNFSPGADEMLALSLRLRAIGYNMTLIFFTMGHALFFYLFWKARYIPPILSLTGVLFYITLLVVTCAGIVVSGTRIDTIVQISASLVMLHQIIIGLWLIAKGLRTADSNFVSAIELPKD